MKHNEKGQILVGAIVLLVILAILVPAIIMYVQNESKWTVKEQQNTRAFQLAEAAVERGFQQVILSSTVWSSLQAGTPINGYKFDQVYSDGNGQYEVNITSGTSSQSCIITGVGRDLTNKEMRAVRAVYGNGVSNPAIYAAGGINLSGNPDVQWGPILSPNAIVTDHLHPRFYSSSSISLDPNGATPPNSDNIQWWSYVPNLPPAPQIDTQGYLSLAQSQGVSHVYTGAAPYGVSLGSVVGTYYFDGDTTFNAANPKNFVDGNIVVMGNLTLQGNSSAQVGSLAVTLPTTAWREYGNDWTTYRGWDTTLTTFPGQNSGYNPGSIPVSLSGLSVNGFLYVGGTLNISGGGNVDLRGSVYMGNFSNLSGSHVTIWYDPTTAATVKTKNVTLARSSWQEVQGCRWNTPTPPNNPTCP